MIDLNSIQAELNYRETNMLVPGATPSMTAVRRRTNDHSKHGYRQDFSLDADRILHSRAYSRYIDKTQVFYLTPNDHITHRALHVQLVSKIARTIGRFLGLNQDLIEAVALGHDIGHPPFGHDGERFLSAICESYGIGFFYHSVQSVHFLDQVERKGAGWNLCLQTLDGILCHDGEIHNQLLRPDKNKTFTILDRQISLKKNDPNVKLIPMSLEGCVVRFADTISYIGRDIEDAIRLKLIQRSNIPIDCTKLLGDSNGVIVYRLVTDLILNSYQQPYIAFSHDISNALEKLKAFNLKKIYLNPAIKQHTKKIEELFGLLFENLLQDLKTKKQTSVIFTGFLDGMAPEYIQAHTSEEIVRDFIAGMTDQYFLRCCPEGLDQLTP